MTHPAVVRGWVPASSCGAGCLPAGNRIRGLRPIRRVIALVAVLVVALTTASMLPLLSARARARWSRAVCRAVLDALGVEVRVRGPRRFGDGGVLVVANHLSWIEILALSAVGPVRLVAKREVRRWFLLGAVAAATGTLFIDRRGLRGLPATVAEIAEALRAGQTVAVFPEGTTWCGSAAGPFRRAPFQGALDAAAPVQPVAVALHCEGRAAPGAAFVGDQNLLDSVVRVLHLPALVCELTLLPPLPPVGDRADLAVRASSAITTATGVVHPPSGRATPATDREAGALLRVWTDTGPAGGGSANHAQPGRHDRRLSSSAGRVAG